MLRPDKEKGIRLVVGAPSPTTESPPSTEDQSSAPDLTTPQGVALDLAHQGQASTRWTLAELPSIRVHTPLPHRPDLTPI